MADLVEVLGILNATGWERAEFGVAQTPASARFLKCDGGVLRTSVYVSVTEICFMCDLLFSDQQPKLERLYFLADTLNVLEYALGYFFGLWSCDTEFPESTEVPVLTLTYVWNTTECVRDSLDEADVSDLCHEIAEKMELVCQAVMKVVELIILEGDGFDPTKVREIIQAHFRVLSPSEGEA